MAMLTMMSHPRHNEQQLVSTQTDDAYWELMDLWTNCDPDDTDDNRTNNAIQGVLQGTARLVPRVLFHRMGAAVNSANEKQADCIITLFDDAQCPCHHHHQIDNRSTADDDQGNVNRNYPECTCPTYGSDDALSSLSNDQDDSTTTTNRRQRRLVADITFPLHNSMSSQQEEPQTDNDDVTGTTCKEPMGTIQVFYDDYNTTGSIIDGQAQQGHYQERLVFLAQRLGRVLTHRCKLQDGESTVSAMQAQQRRLMESQTIAKLGQWELDITTGALTWSDEIYTLFQIDKTQFAASYEAFLNAIHPDDRSFVDQAYTTSLTTRQPYNIIHRLLRDDGTIRWVNEICRTEYDSQTGNPLYSVGIVQDITELKQAQEMDRLKTRFLANMSHEVRTPINAIMGYTDLMLLGDSDSDDDDDDNGESSSRRYHYDGDSISDEDDDSTCRQQQRPNQNNRLSKRNREYLRIIRNSGELLMAIISDILDISKIEAGQLLLDNRSFSLDAMLQLCRDSARAFQNTINRCQHLQIVMRYLNDPESDASHVNADCNKAMEDCIMGDPSRIQQVLNNLLTNACKFTDDNPGARVECGVQLRQQTQQRKTIESDIVHQDHRLFLEFHVRDSGLGIPQDKQRDIFEAFHQVHPTRDSHELGGTGLGLTISKRLVEMMGGRMWLESSTTDTDSQKRGTVVYFTVPYVPAPAAEAATVNNRTNINMDDDTIVVEQPSASLHAKAVVRRLSKRLAATLLPLSPESPTESMTSSSSSCTNASINSSPLPPLSNQVQLSSLAPQPQSPALGKVLIVDDNCVNLKLAVRIVNRLGYDTMTASNGKEAVEVFQKDRAADSVIQCILMDKEMPIMDGLMAVQEIRRIEQLEYQQKVLDDHIPIVALTAAAYREDMEACLAAGCDGYLTKPVKREALQEILALYLDDSHVS